MSQSFLAEAKTLLTDAVANESEDTVEIEAIKRTVFKLHQAGWLHHDFDSYAKLWTEDARSTRGRGEQRGEYDRMKDRSQINGTARLRFQGPPPTRLRISYEVVGAKRNEDQAQLQTRHVVQYGGGFATYGCRWRLHKTPDGWKVFQHRE